MTINVNNGHDDHDNGFGDDDMVMMLVIIMMMRHMLENLGGRYSRIDFTSTIRYLSSTRPRSRSGSSNMSKCH